MKKLCMTMLAVLSCGATYALPVMNPSEASLLCDGICWEGHCGDMCDPCLTWCDAFSVRIGYWGNFVFNRYLETDTNEAKRDVDTSRVITNAAYIAGNFWDRFDIYGTLGATQITLSGDLGIFGVSGADTEATGRYAFDLTTNTDFSWSIGLRGTIWECGCTAVGAEFQYLEARPSLQFLTAYAARTGQVTATRQAFGNGYTAQYQDWQIGLGISHRINLLVPYIAVRWSGAQLDLGDARVLANAAQLEDLNSNKTWGYAVGVSLVDCEKMSLTGEAGFASSLEASVVAQVRF